MLMYKDTSPLNRSAAIMDTVLEVEDGKIGQVGDTL